MENTWYSVISPDSCCYIVWHNWDFKDTAAKQLRLTPDDMLKFGLVDGIIPEPVGGAHWNYDEAAANLKAYLKPVIADLKKIPTQDRLTQRIEKFRKMGFWNEE